MKKNKKHLGWCVTVGRGNIAYIMDNKTFDKRRDAIAYRKAQGSPFLSKHWYITKIGEVK